MVGLLPFFFSFFLNIVWYSKHFAKYSIQLSLTSLGSIPRNSTKLILNIFEIKMTSAVARTSHAVTIRPLSFKAALCVLHTDASLIP